MNYFDKLKLRCILFKNELGDTMILIESAFLIVASLTYYAVWVRYGKAR